MSVFPKMIVSADLPEGSIIVVGVNGYMVFNLETHTGEWHDYRSVDEVAGGVINSIIMDDYEPEPPKVEGLMTLAGALACVADEPYCSEFDVFHRNAESHRRMMDLADRLNATRDKISRRSPWKPRHKLPPHHHVTQHRRHLLPRCACQLNG